MNTPIVFNRNLSNETLFKLEQELQDFKLAGLGSKYEILLEEIENIISKEKRIILENLS